jgi:gamma-glutamylcyclotransferase (GGCT)/AIG2-like uncharacterized protein YtfP
MPTLLFLYGTLRPDRAPAEIAPVARRLAPMAHGTIQARLYDLGAYPGVILDDDALTPVPGQIFRVPDAATLAALDRYEDYRPADPAASLFLRTKAVVTLDDGSCQTCWVYVYNGPPPRDPA